MSARTKYVERAPDVLRRAMQAKIHIASKALGIDGEDYRAVLRRITGLESTAKMSDSQLGLVLDEFRRVGFRSPRTEENEGRPGEAQERLAIALWKDLGALNVLDDPSETGLRKFARRLVGVEAIEWADANQMNKVIEALKAWRARERAKRASP